LDFCQGTKDNNQQGPVAKVKVLTGKSEKQLLYFQRPFIFYQAGFFVSTFIMKIVIKLNYFVKERHI
jgi:hypothetical protein